MPDITMCDGVEITMRLKEGTHEPFAVPVEGGYECPKRKECYRHNAKPNSHQSYFYGLPVVRETGECKSFWLDKPLLPVIK